MCAKLSERRRMSSDICDGSNNISQVLSRNRPISDEICRALNKIHRGTMNTHDGLNEICGIPGKDKKAPTSRRTPKTEARNMECGNLLPLFNGRDLSRPDVASRAATSRRVPNEFVGKRNAAPLGFVLRLAGSALVSFALPAERLAG